jgi:heme oxygenase-like protein
MTAAQQATLTPPFRPEAPQEHIDSAIDSLMASLPDRAKLSTEERRALIARYTAVLEGNFIYWMTATHLAVRSPEAKEKIEENLLEEVKDNHPGMLRKFAVAAHAEPTELDRRAVDPDLQNVRAFVGKMSPLKILLMMAFFEGFIQKFMAYLADLAARSGSSEMVYTDVHGVCDIAHTQGLFHSYAGELALAKNSTPSEELLEGVKLLRTLIQTIVRPK